MTTELHEKEIINDAAVLRRTLTTVNECRTGLAKLVLIPGMVTADMAPQRHKLRLRYDVTQLGIDTVVNFLHESGCDLHDGWFNRMRLAWYRYVDGNARRNYQGSGGACCSTPTSVYTAQHKSK